MACVWQTLNRAKKGSVSPWGHVVTILIVVPAATATEVATTSAHNASGGSFGMSQTRGAPQKTIDDTAKMWYNYFALDTYCVFSKPDHIPVL
jgi:hypothetical protein